MTRIWYIMKWGLAISSLGMAVPPAAAQSPAPVRTPIPASLPSWDQQLDLLKGIGDELAAESGRLDPPERKQEMYRYVMGAVADGWLHYVMQDPARPTWMPEWNYALNYGGPNPDYAYKHTLVDPKGIYRISGYRGTSLFVEITQQIPEFLTPFVNGKPQAPSPGTWDLDMLKIGKDGYFSVILSAERPVGYTGDWWPLSPKTHSLLMRQTQYDWSHEQDPRIAIVRLDPAQPAGPAEISRRIGTLREYTTSLIHAGMWLTRWYRDHVGVNTIKISPIMTATLPFPGQVYLDGAFQIKDDEALILETPVPDKCRYWQILLADDRFATIDWVNRQANLNGFTARRDSDGKFRAVIAARDPGVPNWLDTAGEPWGIIQMRWNHCSSNPEPIVRKVAFAEVRKNLPADTPVVTAEQRHAILLKRWESAQFRRLW